MKSRQVSEILRNQGYERGTQVILEALAEDVNTLKRHQSEMAGMMDKVITALNNVVMGAQGMREEMRRSMRKAGLLEHEDDMGVSTQSIEEH